MTSARRLILALIPAAVAALPVAAQTPAAPASPVAAASARSNWNTPMEPF